MVEVFRGIFLASVIGVPLVDRRSKVDRISLAVDESGAGDVEDGPGELCGDEGAVDGREDGGMVSLWTPSAGGNVRGPCLAFLSAFLFLIAAPYGLADCSLVLLADPSPPNITGPP